MKSALPRESLLSFSESSSSAIERSSSAIVARSWSDRVPVAPWVISSVTRSKAVPTAFSAVSARSASAAARSRLLFHAASFAWARPIEEMRAAATGSSDGDWMRFWVDSWVCALAMSRDRASCRLISWSRR